MTGQMGSALGKLAGSRSEGACVCVWGGGGAGCISCLCRRVYCASCTGVLLSPLLFLIPREERVN